MIIPNGPRRGPRYVNRQVDNKTVNSVDWIVRYELVAYLPSEALRFEKGRDVLGQLAQDARIVEVLRTEAL